MHEFQKRNDLKSTPQLYTIRKLKKKSTLNTNWQKEENLDEMGKFLEMHDIPKFTKKINGKSK